MPTIGSPSRTAASVRRRGEDIGAFPIPSTLRFSLAPEVSILTVPPPVAPGIEVATIVRESSLP